MGATGSIDQYHNSSEGGSYIQNLVNDNLQHAVKVHTEKYSKKETVPFPKNGITIKGMKEFIEKCGGENEFVGLSTTDVNIRFLMPATASTRQSYCDMISESGNPEVGVADVFISHAWKFLFLDVINALCVHFSSAPNTVLWFDLFSNNQHLAVSLDFDWWSTTFMSAIRQFGHVVMVLAPWNNPIPFTRAWCLFEIYSAIFTNSVFDVALSQGETEAFVKSITSDFSGYLKMLSAIDVSRSESFNPSDKAQIFEVVKAHVGMDRVNAMILSRLRSWVAGVIEKSLNSTGLSELDIYRRRLALAGTYSAQGSYTQARILFEQCAENSPALGGVYNDLSALCTAHGHLEDGMDYATKALLENIASLGSEHLWVGYSYNNIGLVYVHRGNFSLAISNFEKAMDVIVKACGERDPSVASLYGNCAEACRHEGRLKEAEIYNSKCLDIRLSTLGPNHPDVATSYNNIAMVYQAMGRYEESLSEFENCQGILLKVLGNDHPTVASTYMNLAEVCRLTGRLEDAISYGQKALSTRIQCFGETHVYVGDAYNNLAVAYGMKKEYLQAVEYHQKALVSFTECAWRKRDVSRVYSNMAELYKSMGRLDDAVESYKNSLSALTLLNSPPRSEVAALNYFMGDVLRALGKHEEAAEAFECSRRCYSSLPDMKYKLLQCYADLVNEYTCLEQYDRVLSLLQDVQTLCTDVYGEDSMETASAIVRKGDIFAKLNQANVAYEHYDKVRCQLAPSLGDDHPLMTKLSEKIASVRPSSPV